jgi:hypothetical protein
VPSIAFSSQGQVGSSDLDKNTRQSNQTNDFDSDPHEYVGLDDEFMYFPDSEEGIHQTQSVENIVQYVHIDSNPILEENVHDDVNIDDTIQCELVIINDTENPKIEVGTLFLDVDAFRMTLRHFAIIYEFEVSTVKSDKKKVHKKMQTS